MRAAFIQGHPAFHPDGSIRFRLPTSPLAYPDSSRPRQLVPFDDVVAPRSARRDSAGLTS